MATVIITGASMGIGRALALAWAKRGSTVVLSARGLPALEEVAREVEREGGRALVVAGDVTDETHRVALVERAIAETGSLDVLVNNAGRGYYARALDVDVETLRLLFELNVVAPLRLAQIAMPHLERSRGAVVMMSSIAGVIAAPRYAAYSASKFALEAIAMAMRAELAASGVDVVVVRPGPVATPFRENAEKASNEVLERLPERKPQTAEEVAEVTLRAVDRRRAVAETSAYVRAASAASRFLPGPIRSVLRRLATTR